MTNQHSMTPPPELLEQWVNTAQKLEGPLAYTKSIALQAAQWGADQELEACIELLKADGYKGKAIDLRAARRPKPPSLKEQALELVRRIEGTGSPWALSELSVVRRALEALPND